MLNIDKKTLRQADKIICDTKAHGNYFAQELGAHPEKLQVLYLEADKSIYYPRHGEKPQEARESLLFFILEVFFHYRGLKLCWKL